MIIRKFHAQTEEEAIGMARAALGPDAIVITSTPKRTGNWVTRWFRKPGVELVAGKPRPVAETHPGYTSGVFRIPTPVPGVPTSNHTFMNLTLGADPVFGASHSPSESPPPQARRVRTPEAGTGGHVLTGYPSGSPVSSQPPPPPPAMAPRSYASQPPAPAPGAVTPLGPFPGAAPSLSMPPCPATATTSVPSAPVPTQAAPEVPSLKQDMDELKAQVAELKDLRGMLEQVLKHQSSELAPVPEAAAATAVRAIEELPAAPKLPTAVRGLLEGLRAGQVDGGLRKLVKERLLKNLDEEGQRDADKVYQEAIAAIASQIKVGSALDAFERKQDQPHLLILVGPTGVGKTTTLAKLAAGFQFQYGKKAAFVTLDTYRIGAPEQLKQYAEIIDIPIQVVFKPEDLRGAIQQFKDQDVVLIDTVGRSHRNQEDIEDLSRYLAGLDNAEIYLVLSANTKNQDLREALEVFRDLGVKGLIMTKLDETSSYEDMVNLMVREKVPVHFVTTGQSVPDDIQSARAEEIARLITPTPPAKKPGERQEARAKKVQAEAFEEGEFLSV